MATTQRLLARVVEHTGLIAWDYRPSILSAKSAEVVEPLQQVVELGEHFSGRFAVVRGFGTREIGGVRRGQIGKPR